MIDPKELRWGSIVAAQGGGIPREGITWSDYAILEPYGVFMAQTNKCTYDPIPITPEWLERLGFAVGKRSIYKDFGFFEIEYERDQLYIGINEYQDSLYHIQYVHQLQNLVYSLTGQELIIKQ